MSESGKKGEHYFDMEVNKVESKGTNITDGPKQLAERALLSENVLGNDLSILLLCFD